MKIPSSPTFILVSFLLIAYSPIRALAQFADKYSLLDSVEHYVFTSEGDSTCIKKSYYESNSHGFIDQHITVEFNSESLTWNQTDKFSYAYDNFGRDTLYEGYSWDEISNSWKFQHRRVNQYDLKGRELQYSDYYWDNNNQSICGRLREDREYNSDGFLYNYKSSSWNSISDTWHADSLRQHFPDELGNDTLLYVTQWQTDKRRWEITVKDKTDWTYNDHNQVLTRITSQLDFEASMLGFVWLLSSKLEYNYSLSADTVFEESFLRSDDSWVPSHRCTTIYKQDKQVVFTQKNIWDSQMNGYVKTSQTLQEYNSRGQCTGFEKYTNTPGTNSWTGKSKTNWVYNEVGVLVCYEQYKWKSNFSKWDVDNKDYHYYTEFDEIPAPQLSIDNDTIKIGDGIEVVCTKFGSIHLVPISTKPTDDIESRSLSMAIVNGTEPVTLSTNEIVKEGEYLIYAIDTDRNVSLASIVWIFQNVLSVKQYSKFEYKIYPTQVSNSFMIESDTDITSVKVYDMMGRLRKSFCDNLQNRGCDNSELKKGFYCIQINNLKSQSTVICKF